MESLEQIGIKAKKASRYLAKLGIDEKNKALEAVADALVSNAEYIICLLYTSPSPRDCS